MLSRKTASHLFDHILDGFKSSDQGIKLLKEEGIIQDAEFTELLEKNSARLIDRIYEFKVMHKLVSIFFAGVFTVMQIQGDDLDMRRTSRTRGGRRRNDKELAL
jgi:hypothetical protein